MSEVALAALTEGPWGTLVWGGCRPVVNRVLFALAEANDPSPYWLDIQDPSEGAEDGGPVRLGWIRPDHLYLTAGLDEARPQESLGNLAIGNLVRSDEPGRTILKLAEFVRLPEVAQKVISLLGTDGAPHVISIANSDRIRDSFPLDPAEVRHVFDAFLDAHLHPFFSVTGPGTERRWASDFVFEVTATGLDRWKDGALVCEKAPGGSPFRPGGAYPLHAVPAIARALGDSTPAP